MFYSLYVGLMIAAFMLLVLSVILFFVWNIPNVHSELSGRKTRERVRKLQEINRKNPDEFSTSDIFYRSGNDSGSLVRELNSYLEDEEESAISGAVGLATGLFGSRTKNEESTGSPTEEIAAVASEITVTQEPEYDESPYEGFTGHGVELGTELPKPPSVFPAVGTVEPAFEEDSSTGVFDEADEDGTDTWDGGVFSRSRRVIVVEEKTSLS